MDVLFDALSANRQKVADTTAAQRVAKLQRLRDSLLRYRQEVRDALYADFRRHPSEVDLTEIFPVTAEIKHTISHLARWMRPQPVPTPAALLGSRSWIQWQPKGVALIISPWNFPVNLTLGPLVSAVAAGNVVMLKPSEHTPHSTAVIKTIVRDVFDGDEVALVEGDAEVAQSVLKLPFQHIFFTGSPAVGKLVMKAAAEHLASVTLELGGKSPTIVAADADLNAAARRIAWAKWLNNGQICIAPDYLFAHESCHDELVTRIGQNLRKFYGDQPQNSPSYARLVNRRQFDRIASYLDQPGRAEYRGVEMDASDLYVQPTLLTNAETTDKIMGDEIFGPVLPVLRFKDIEEPVRHIASGEKPLALYLYTRDQKTVDYVLRHTRAGGTSINHNGLHYFNLDLPFGGDNYSGLGKSHGVFGFQAFSNARAVLQQRTAFSPIELMMPPYGGRIKQALIDFTVRWF